MNILIVNDDGIQADGIKALAQALSSVADVYVCAPNGQRSARSQAISIKTDVYVEEVEFPFAKRAYSVDGTPADCTKIGLQFGIQNNAPIDMVFSGINIGSNLGLDTVYSGTVGAAMEAAMENVHAVAVSVDGHKPKHFEYACKLAIKMIDAVYGKIPTNTIMNINTPDLPVDRIKGVRVTKLGPRYYDDYFKSEDGKVFRLTGNPPEDFDADSDTDIVANCECYASVTPLRFDYTDYRILEKIKEWDLTV